MNTIIRCMNCVRPSDVLDALKHHGHSGFAWAGDRKTIEAADDGGNILICVPWFGDYYIVPWSVQRKCEACGCAVAVAPSSVWLLQQEH